MRKMVVGNWYYVDICNHKEQRLLKEEILEEERGPRARLFQY